MLYRWDQQIIDAIEKRCHTIQIRTGINNFSFARLAHVLTVVCVSVPIIFMPDVAMQAAIAIALMALMYARILWNMYAVVEDYYRSPQSAVHPHTKMWRSIFFARLQAVLAILGCLFYGATHFFETKGLPIPYAMGGVFWLAALYIQCAIPLPPSAHWEWKKAQSRSHATQELVRNPTR